LLGYEEFDREIRDCTSLLKCPPLEIKTSPNPDTLDYLADIKKGKRTVQRQFKYCKIIEFIIGDIPFLLKIMGLDPREPPTANELLEDGWVKRDAL
jgi:hypothetical protein